jgi:hypothetical protein
MVKQADLTGEKLFCPRCRTDSPRSEWWLLFRRVRGPGEGLPPVRLLKHRRCSEIVYFLVK